MKSVQATSDKFAIGLSFACVFHCLVTPLLLVALPSIASFLPTNELFHIGMVVAVIPSSLLALTLGCKKHGRKHVFILGTVGITLLVGALLSEAFASELVEKSLTLLGSLFVTAGHVINYRLCAKHNDDNCPCPEQN